MINIAGYCNSSGTRFWRFADPFKYLNTHDGFRAVLFDEQVKEEVLQWADVYVINGLVDKDAIALMYQYQQEKGKKLVVDRDDWLELEKDSVFYEENVKSDAMSVIGRTIEVADMVTASTKPLKKALEPLNKNVVVLPNSLDTDRWDLPKLTNTSDTIRIGWAGSMTHVSDIEMIVDPVKRILDEFPNAWLVLVGEPRLAKLFEGYKVECQGGVPFEAWPSKLHSLRLDIGLAPLRSNSMFNQCKSNIKWQEYAIAKVPGVYSPTVYKNKWFDGKLGMIAEDSEQWYRCIKNYILHPILREEVITHAYAAVRDFNSLKANHHEWVKTYNSLWQQM